MPDIHRARIEAPDPDWQDLPLAYGDIPEIPENEGRGHCRHRAIVACCGRVKCVSCGEIIG